jgi:transcriptional antiterminator NusG
VSKRYDSTKQWYAIHTYSGYEEKVAESIRQRAESLDMGDKIFQVLVPKEKSSKKEFFRDMYWLR